MQFARVHGVVVARDDSLELRVSLDTGTRVTDIRSETVPYLAQCSEHDLNWHADQYTQETIGNELALQGWEAIAEQPAGAGLPGMGQSSIYTVRRTVSE